MNGSEPTGTEGCCVVAMRILAAGSTMCPETIVGSAAALEEGTHFVKRNYLSYNDLSHTIILYICKPSLSFQKVQPTQEHYRLKVYVVPPADPRFVSRDQICLDSCDQPYCLPLLGGFIAAGGPVLVHWLLRGLRCYELGSLCFAAQVSVAAAEAGHLDCATLRTS
eukprot:Skav220357  [mRNA]  locus=scaffold609:58200:58697:+ [translate_table: standard]